MENEREQLFVLAKGHKAKALELIIEKVIRDATIYQFSEFLDIETVQNLGKDNKHFKTLELFAYDNYSDYMSNQDNYVKLDEKQLKKLKMLSVVTMAGKDKTLTYDNLKSSLDIDSKQDLEEILLELIYNRLINATLEEKTKVVHVEWTFGRDAKAEDIDEMVSKLEDWVSKMEHVEQKIESHIEDLDSKLLESKQEKREFISNCMQVNETEKKSGFDKFTSILTSPFGRKAK